MTQIVTIINVRCVNAHKFVYYMVSIFLCYFGYTKCSWFRFHWSVNDIRHASNTHELYYSASSLSSTAGPVRMVNLIAEVVGHMPLDVVVVQ